MNTVRNATLALLTCVPLLGACQQSSAPTSTSSSESPTTTLGKAVEDATHEARAKLANEPITLSSDHDTTPKAEISPQGDLLIDGKAVPVTQAQRALLLEHRANFIAIAEAGMTIGVRGADLGMRAAGEALKGVFSGNTDEIEKRIEAEAEKIKADAAVLCNQLPAALESQQKLAAALPQFKPYATMTAKDIDDCRDETEGKTAADSAPTAPTAPPAPAAPAAPAAPPAPKEG